MDDGHARVKMEEVRAHLDRTWFAWIGSTEPGGVFYYRIHSPVILIEFDHQVPANLKHLAKDPNAPNPQHIHVVVRTPNGNDYGKDLLRQHYELASAQSEWPAGFKAGRLKAEASCLRHLPPLVLGLSLRLWNFRRF